MAEDHRRVEPRQIVGTGMATDPERIALVAADAERRGRAWREAPEAAFGDVLGRAPARGELADEPPPKQPTATATAAADAAGMTGPMTATAKAPVATPAKPLRASLRAPDPRQRALQLELDRAIAASSSRRDS